MDKIIKYKLNSKRSVLNVDTNISTNVEFSNETNVLPVGEINHVLNVGSQFNKERNETTTYRFLFTITPLFSNVLYNVRGKIGYGPFGESTIPKFGNGLRSFSDPLFLEDPYDNDFVGEIELSYEEAISRHLKEVDGWFGFYDPDLTRVTECKFYDLEPTRERFDLNLNLFDNWGVTITYPSSIDTTHHIVNGGLLIVNAEEVEVGGVPMVALGTATKHGLKNGDKVKLSDMPSPMYEGTFNVKRLGLNNGDYKDNYFVIDVNPSVVPINNLFTTGRLKRVINSEESSYYIRKFKKLMVNDNDYEIYPLAYSKTIYKDNIYQMVVNQEIDVNGLTDNLGRPLSELYLTFIKKGSGNIFGKVSSGFDLELLSGNLNEDVSNVRRMHDGPSNDPNYFTSQSSLEFRVGMNYSEFYGDIVEYNRFELKEKVLSEVLHRFNTVDREQSFINQPNSDGRIELANGPRREGYLYKPHHLIKIRNFSLYIEQGDINTANIPDYAEDLGDGRWLWRDLLDIGSFDGAGERLNYPFTNGNHYIHKQIFLSTTRQDPFGVYDLFYNGINTETEFSPSDQIGDGITDKYVTKINRNEDC